MTDPIQQRFGISDTLQESLLIQSMEHSQPEQTAIPLPPDLTIKIFCMLNVHSQQAFACVSKNMNLLALIAATHNEQASINKFVKFIFDNLKGDELTPQREKLTLLAEKIPSMIPKEGHFPSLLSLKHDLIFKIKKQLIDIIKTCNSKTDLQLKCLEPPHFMHNICRLLPIYGKIRPAMLIQDESWRSLALTNICQNLLDANDIENSLEIANFIPIELWKNSSLQRISWALNKQGDINRSLTVVNSMSDRETKDSTLNSIVLLLSQQGNIDKSLTVANSISDRFKKNSSIAIVAITLAKQGDIDRSLALIDSISEEKSKNSVLTSISEVLAKHGDIDRSLALVDTIPEKSFKDVALTHISKVLIDHRDVERSLTVAHSISVEYSKAKALKYISMRLSEGHL